MLGKQKMDLWGIRLLCGGEARLAIALQQGGSEVLADNRTGDS